MLSWPILGGLFDLDARREEIGALEHEISAPDFWNDQTGAQKVMKQVAALKQSIELWESFRRRLEDLQVTIDLAEEALDAELRRDAISQEKELETAVREYELQILLEGKYD